jgi:hypothetical protein
VALIGVADVHVLGIADGACVHADPTAMTATLDDLIQFGEPVLIETRLHRIATGAGCGP